jgi:branched-subunit amino acid aminotransferase/4-amino-4-deoxychorismate lyase
MHKFLSFNHKITAASEIYLPAVSSLAFYGRGIFTTVAVYNSKPFQWGNHWRRLSENAKITGIELSEFTQEQVKNSLLEIISSNNLLIGRARITFFDESVPAIWQTKSERGTSLLITTADFRAVPENLHLTFSPFLLNSKSPLAGVKSCNYLENLLALEEAKLRGFDEAIRLNERSEIASAVMANIFWVRNKRIFTPELASGALCGTTRDFVLENFPVEEKSVAPDEIESADEVFISSAGIGIARVASIDEKTFSKSTVLEKIRQNFLEHTR